MDLIDLARGQPQGPPPDGAVQRARAALGRDCSEYTPPLGLPSFRQAAAELLGEQLGRAAAPREVMATHGATAGLHACILAFTEPDAEVWVTDPGWTGFPESLRVLGRRARCGPLDALPPEGPRLVLLASPDNPTGALPTPAARTALRRKLTADPEAILVCDETYRDLVYDGEHGSLGCDPELAGRTVLLRSFSKSHAMAGWRVGWLAAPPALSPPLRELLEAQHGCPSTPSQHGALWALRQGRPWMAQRLARCQARRDRLAAGLARVPGLEVERCAGGLYLFPRVGGESEVCAQRLLREAGIRVVPGRRFGPRGEGHIRLCFDRDEAVLQAAIERLVPILSRWMQREAPSASPPERP
jgi:aspartate/methionine/tyrosine aminotransferase